MADAIRVLGVCGRMLPLVGGAQISAALLLSQMQRNFGYRCQMVGIGGDPTPARVRGLHIHTAEDEEALVSAIRAFRPDALFSALEAAVPVARIAQRFDVPHVVWMQSFEFCPPTASEARAWQVMTDRVYPTATDRLEVCRTASAMLTNSAFLQARVRRMGCRSTVMYPAFAPDDFMVARRRHGGGTYVAGVCGYGYKGANIFLALAESMPDVPFLLVGRTIEPWFSRASALANVTVRAFSSPREFLADARVMLVPSQWPEPFGRVAVEAMANGIPTLVSGTGGLVECSDPACIVRAFRSPAAWRRALTRVLDDDAHADALARAGRVRAQRFLGLGPAATFDRTVRRMLRGRRRAWPARPLAAIVGNRAAATAFALINRQWTRTDKARDIQIVSRTVAEADAALADVHIRHDFSREFDSWPPPASGHVVAVRTWDFGPYPRAWVEAINANYDDLWVMTSWVRRQAIASGIAPERVHVVPLGVDPMVFRPGNRAAQSRRRRPFTFLFVGAAVVRKGVDILLRAYRSAFTRNSEVRLVVKINPDDVFYGEDNLRATLQAAAADETGAPIVVIDRFMPAGRLAALYRSADAGVFPYRAEGFCLPILEAMACGVPAIVPNFGAALDFCSPRTSWLVPVRRIAVPIGRAFAINSLGFTEQVEAVDFCEMSVEALADAMRTAAGTNALVREKMARRGLETAARFTWDASASRLHRRIAQILRRRVPVRIATERHARAEHARIFATARDLYLRG